MAKEASFDNLIKAIQQAFISVNDMSEAQHIAKLEEYFDDGGMPKTFDMQYPYFDEAGHPAYKTVSIPEICLVPISSLKLDEIEVDFKVQLYGKVNLAQEGGATDEAPNAAANEMPKGGPLRRRPPDRDKTFLGYIPHGGGFKNKEESYASVRLKFVSQEPPEGLVRIRDQFVKVTI